VAENGNIYHYIGDKRKGRFRWENGDGPWNYERDEKYLVTENVVVHTACINIPYAVRQIIVIVPTIAWDRTDNDEIFLKQNAQNCTADTLETNKWRLRVI